MASGSETEIPTWPLSVYRLVASISAVLVLNQAVLAGRFLGGEYGAVGLHAQNGIITLASMGVQAIAAGVLWVRGNGPLWIVPGTLGLALATGAQLGLGYAHNIGIHVPLGVTIMALSTLVLVWSWRFDPSARRATAADPAGAGSS